MVDAITLEVVLFEVDVVVADCADAMPKDASAPTAKSATTATIKRLLLLKLK
ncbi:MAG: hypothetical protein ACYC7D_01440 [Nitrososphaerales archaeon]